MSRTVERAFNGARPPLYRRPGVWLVVVAFLMYNANLRVGGCFDDNHRLLPLAILRHGTLSFEPYRHLLTGPDGRLFHHVVEHGGTLMSIYPLATGLLAIPLYLIPALVVGGDLPVLLLGKLTASLFVALSAGLVYASLRRLGAGARRALTIGSIYAFGTSVFAVASQALCQHPAATLAVAAVVYCAVRARSDPAVWCSLGALAAGGAVAIRPQTAVTVAAIGVYLFARASRTRLEVMSAAVAALVPAIALNVITVGTVAGGYELAVQNFPDLRFDANIAVGTLGLLISPGRGLFAFSPILLFAVYGAWRAFHRRNGLMISLALGVIATVMFYGRFHYWWGGFTFGPRYLTEAMPMAALLLDPVLRSPSALDRGVVRPLVFVTAAIAAIFVQVVGAFGSPCSWDGRPRSVMEHPERNWDWRDTPLTRCVREVHLDSGSVFEVTRGLERSKR